MVQPMPLPGRRWAAILGGDRPVVVRQAPRRPGPNQLARVPPRVTVRPVERVGNGREKERDEPPVLLGPAEALQRHRPRRGVGEALGVLVDRLGAEVARGRSHDGDGVVAPALGQLPGQPLDRRAHRAGMDRARQPFVGESVTLTMTRPPYRLSRKGPGHGTLGSVPTYAPNRAHKREWTDAGPPAFRSDKSPRPPEITAIECAELLQTSIPEDPVDPRSRRYAVRRSDHGAELFAAQAHSPAGQDPVEFHGYPVPTAPAKVLRQLRDRGDLLAPEYRQLIRGLS